MMEPLRMDTPTSVIPAVESPSPTATPAATGTPAVVPPVPAVIPSDGAPVEGADDVTITSTTDTQAEVQAALEHKVPAADAKPAPAATPAAPKTDGTPAAPPAPVPDPASEAGKVLAKKGRSLQERIDEVTFQREEARRAGEASAADNARLRAENEALKAGKPAPGAAPPVVAKTEAPPKPVLKDFEAEPDPYAAWTEALTDWKADRASDKVRAEFEGKIAANQQADEARRGQEQQQTEYQQVMQTFATRSRAFRDTFGAEKYDTAVAQIKAEVADGTREEQVYPPPMEIHVTRSDMGPALIYHFAQNPDDFLRIKALPYGPMLAALGKLEGKLETTYAPAATTVPATPSTPAARAIDALASSSITAAPVSTALPPPTLVGSGASATTVPLEDMDFRTFSATRNAAERRRR